MSDEWTGFVTKPTTSAVQGPAIPAGDNFLQAEALLRAEITELKKQRDEWKAEALRLDEAHDEEHLKVRALRERETQLVEALETYGRHKRDCRVNPGGRIMEALGDPEKRPCSCGLEAALLRSRGAQPVGVPGEGEKTNG